MANHSKEEKNTILYIIMAMVIIAILVLGTYFVLDNASKQVDGGLVSKSIKEETITAENYEEMMDKIKKEMKEDEELYYLSYSVMYYMFQDGLSSVWQGAEDESAMYVNIYGKTIKQLIEEGKQQMEDNNMTIEKFKEEIEKMENTIIQ